MFDSNIFSFLKDPESLLQKAREMGGKMQEIQDILSQIRGKGSAAGGMVEVEANGHLHLVSCKIDPALFNNGDHELLEELIVVAANEAITESRKKQNQTYMNNFGDEIPSLEDVISKVMSK
ncbi:MAG: YbaB/EbfC family nucleoid-associated protein [Planctomycetaceae bacterium]|jgi:DNA-binding YbaB/EbfC family protein|nr:YbaB/EbfC family nucleoid-associated protein [Planctomycetaceae bacterium]